MISNLPTASGFGNSPFWETSHSPALSPLDGRYRPLVSSLSDWLSEDALNRARLYVEVQWFEFALDSKLIPGLPSLSTEERQYLRSLPSNFDAHARERLAAFEAETRHDVKAVEYLLRDHIGRSANPEIAALLELTHFLCTSEDINNLAYALCIREALHQVWLPAAHALQNDLAKMAVEAADAVMLARTHGQAATPSTMGKELAVFAARMTRQLERIEATEFLGKLNGATGTYSAHVAVLPGRDWRALSKQFVTSLGLSWNALTTQIEPHDWQVDLYSDMAHFNRIAHNFATDAWQYISLGYFSQRTEGTTGSSTMPHKINPIRFENAEANLELSNAILELLAASLSTTRLQRDLSDSSLQRNIGVAFGYSLVALQNLRSGLSRLGVDRDLMLLELEGHPEVLSEAIQQALRLGDLMGLKSEDGVEPYALLKDLTRGRKVTLEDLLEVIRQSPLPPELQEALLAMTPSGYTGLAEQLALGVEPSGGNAKASTADQKPADRT